MERLRISGKFQDALIVVTSDHGNWDFPGEDKRRVPLLIKLPGQASAHTIDEPFGNYRLTPIIEGVLSGTIREDDVQRIVRSDQASVQSSASPPRRS
jgi:hypothetical protein